jgi:hypothetical protein
MPPKPIDRCSIEPWPVRYRRLHRRNQRRILLSSWTGLGRQCYWLKPHPSSRTGSIRYWLGYVGPTGINAPAKHLGIAAALVPRRNTNRTVHVEKAIAQTIGTNLRAEANDISVEPVVEGIVTHCTTAKTEPYGNLEPTRWISSPTQQRSQKLDPFLCVPDLRDFVGRACKRQVSLTLDL